MSDEEVDDDYYEYDEEIDYNYGFGDDYEVKFTSCMLC